MLSALNDTFDSNYFQSLLLVYIMKLSVTQRHGVEGWVIVKVNVNVNLNPGSGHEGPERE